jgi:NADH:ubiquinone oxidoreductase subunit C
MQKNNISKIKQIDLRKAWKHEANDFTNWLAEEENLSLLSDEIGIDLKLIQTEANVGKFNVDILAEEDNTGRKIIIENQLEMTNHDHLGKIITYASGYDAEIIIWIVRDVRDEHKQAIDWLNEHTDEDIYFFAIKMELWQIDNSPYAPKFQIISKPNDWAKALRALTTKNNLTETKILQLDYWTKFSDYLKENSKILKARKPRPQHWYDLSIGSFDAHLSLTINSREDQVACEVYIKENKDLYHFLKNKQVEIEKELKCRLVWMPLENKKASRVKIIREADFSERESWDDYIIWMKENAEKFYKTFGKFIRRYKR